MTDPHRVLGVAPGAEPEVIASAYRALALKYHPDRNPEGEARMKAVNEAFAVLSRAAEGVTVSAEDPESTPPSRPPVNTHAAEHGGGTSAPWAAETQRCRPRMRRSWDWIPILLVALSVTLFTAMVGHVGVAEAIAPALTIGYGLTATVVGWCLMGIGLGQIRDQVDARFDRALLLLRLLLALPVGLPGLPLVVLFTFLRRLSR